ncbi:unnamed protein product [Chrysoparadoxa australica]
MGPAISVAESEDLEQACNRGPEGAGDGRPKWAPDGVPTWVVNMHPGTQLCITLVLYMFHMLCLSKAGIALPVQLLPNNHGLLQSIGLDSLAGFVVLGVGAWLKGKSSPAASLEGGEAKGQGCVQQARLAPWNLEEESSGIRSKMVPLCLALGIAYLCSGWASLMWEFLLYFVASKGVPLTIAMHRSLQVLLGHMMWVAMGTKILGSQLKPFFNLKKGKWLKLKIKTYWLWWVIGGYFVSVSMFNVADIVNQFVFPLPAETETVVAKMINPEDNDLLAMGVGALAPCVSAPWWEEVLYRGFLLPSLTLYMSGKLSLAVPVSAVLFAAHHMSLGSMIPLSVLGLVWSVLYILSGNLWVTIMIHALWNARVFGVQLLG